MCVEETRQHKTQEINVSTFDRRRELIRVQSPGGGLAGGKGACDQTGDVIPLDARDKFNKLLKVRLHCFLHCFTSSLLLDFCNAQFRISPSAKIP